MMIFVTIGTATVMFASAQQQSTNATGPAAEHTEGEAGGTCSQRLYCSSISR